MKIEFIYTFESGEKKVEYPFVWPIIHEKKTVAKFATTDLTDEELHSLVKIHVNVFLHCEPIEVRPDWYYESDGVIYFKNGHPI